MVTRPAGRVGLVLQRPLSRRDYDRLGVGHFLSQGLAVTVFDAAEVVVPELRHDRPAYPELQAVDLRILTSRRAVADADFAGCDVIFNHAEGGYVSPQNLCVLRALARCGRPIVLCASNSFPGWDRAPEGSAGWVARLKDAWTRRREIRPLASLCARLPPRLLGVRPADFIVRGGRVDLGNRLIGPGTRVIAAHAMDYDLYLQVMATRPQPTGTALFIDEYRPYHSDLAAMGYDHIVSPEVYFPQIRALFDRVERELGLDVVIAVSPRSDYSDKPGVFGSRRMVPAATARLIAESSLVLAHRSTAIGFAILFDKPVLQIATLDNYRHPTQTPYFDGFAALLGKPVQFYEDPAAADLSLAFAIDKDRYRRYVEDYVKRPESPSRPYWHIVHGVLAEAGHLAALRLDSPGAFE